MKISFHTIASGSNGNASVLFTPEGALLIDDGIARKRILSAFQQLSISLDEIKGILVTHGHTDHVQGLPVLSSVLDVPVYCSPGTRQQFIALQRNDARWLAIARQAVVNPPGSDFEIGPFSVKSLPTKHDAEDSVGYQIAYNDEMATIITDTGELAPHHLQALEESSIALIEMNHDVEALLTSRRPVFLKQRIRACHMSNEKTLTSLTELVESNIEKLYVGHLSGECNSPDMVKDEIVLWEVEQAVPWEWSVCRRDGITEKFDIDREMLKNSSASEEMIKKKKFRKRSRIGKVKTLDQFFHQHNT
ncbi:MAG: MBL fold metallo-hydrolase [Candidatus Odinarchaeota archaeon]